MPVWSIEEILECRELMYSDTPEDVVKECFRRWGGVARYVLDYATFEDQQQFLDEVLDRVDLEWLVRFCCRLDENEAAHRLLQYCVNEKFKDEYFVFASQYVQQEVYSRLYAQNKRKLFEFIAKSGDVGVYAVLRGLLFEGYVHSVLPQGGTFRVRRLININKVGDGNGALMADDDVSTISFPRSKKIVFNSDSDILSAANSIYLEPAMKNYESVDAIMKPDILFQVTGARKHPFIQKGFRDVLKLLGDPEALQLYIVLPPDGFANFPYLNSERKRVAMPSYMNALNIQLFAMEVKPDSEEKKRTWAGSSEAPKQGSKRRHA